MDKSKKYIISMILLCLLLPLFSCGVPEPPYPVTPKPQKTLPGGLVEVTPPPPPTATPNWQSQLVNNGGMTVTTRYTLPKGFVRIDAAPNSFATYLRNFPLQKVGSPVNIYGDITRTANNDEAILNQKLPTMDLFHAPDGIISLYSNYLFEQKQYDNIAFSFVNGFYFEYAKWRAGQRLKVDKKSIAWAQTASADTSKNSLQKYLETLYVFGNFESLQRKTSPIPLTQMQVGDLFLRMNAPYPHCAIVVDMAKDPETGKVIFMLAAGFSPSQPMQIVRNSADPNLSPWFDISFDEYFKTSHGNFEKRHLMRLR